MKWPFVTVQGGPIWDLEFWRRHVGVWQGGWTWPRGRVPWVVGAGRWAGHVRAAMELAPSTGQVNPVRSMVRQAENIRSRDGW